MVYDSTKSAVGGKMLILETDVGPKQYFCKENYHICHYYRGYLKTINCYAITYCSKSYCNSWLLNKRTGKVIKLISPFDNESSIPIISKNKKYAMVYSSSVFNKESFLHCYKINKNIGVIDFELLGSYFSDKWRVKELIWIDTKTIALIVYSKEDNTGLLEKKCLKVMIDSL